MFSVTNLLLYTLKGGRMKQRGFSTDSDVRSVTRSIIPDLSPSLYKGQCGRIGVVGGCKEYTGAPYFSAISALKVGADLSHVFCTAGAAPVIKAYSPELIVHPILDATNVDSEMKQWLPRMHALVIGPGLGRDPALLGHVKGIIQRAKDLEIPMVIDADGTFLLSQDPSVIHGYSKAIITPNAVEFDRLYEAVLGNKPDSCKLPSAVSDLSSALGHVTVLRKGGEDIISNGRNMLVCADEGNPRRCGGQGDLLAGSMGVFTYWAHRTHHSFPPEYSPTLIAAYSACSLTRECGRRAYNKHGRSTMTSNMIEEVQVAFEHLFG